MTVREQIFEMINEERLNQAARSGGPTHDDQLSLDMWRDIIRAYVRRVEDAAGSGRPILQSLLQVAAVVVACIESLQRRGLVTVVAPDDLPACGHPMFHELLKTMAEIHNAKNQDYGDGKPLGNFEEARDLGVEPWRGALIRMSDKWSRVKSLANKDEQKGAVDDESFEDTLIDLANYSLLTIVLRREERGDV
jgi:hypothetical protein